MELLPLPTGLINEGEDIAERLLELTTIKAGDIVAVSSKVIAYSEGAKIDLSAITPSEEAHMWADKLNRTRHHPAFRQAVLDETARMNGRVLESCPLLMYTELKPKGMAEGKTILSVNGGLDMSNIEDGYTIGWPLDPLESVERIHATISKAVGNVGVIVTDSCCLPRRWGVMAITMTVAGFEPIKKEIGGSDLFNHPLEMTNEATADQLATAANYLMGNAAQATPGAVVRDHGLELTDFCGWVPGMDPAEDIFQGIV